MSIRVQTNADIVFGIMGAAVTVTHVRFRVASDDGEPVVRQLTSPLAVNADERLRIPSGMLDIVYPEGQLTNAHMLEVVTPYWDGVEFEVDMMTSATQVVTTAGYSQQTYSAWQISSE